MKNFNHQDDVCEMLLGELGSCWHLWTPENHPIIFTDSSLFKSGMSLFAFAWQSFPDIRILSFVLMSNHIHVCCCGEESRVRAFFAQYKKYLLKHFRFMERNDSLSGFECHLRRLDSLRDVRNVIVYDNRNPIVVNPAYTPFSYPWGAGSAYFNHEAKLRYAQCSRKITTREARAITHSREADTGTRLRILDDYVSPLSFCSIKIGESLFRSARDYFHLLGRNMESDRKIAMEIGERAYYDDQDLYDAVMHVCRKQYGKPNASLLSVEEKLDLARHMKYQYNASNKQIQRILKLQSGVVESIFPQTH